MAVETSPEVASVNGAGLSEAESAARVELMAGSAPLHCDNCGRDCKHVPQLPGGGTAGGEKGTKWEASPRSEARCPSCDQKPHRKEGRPQQEWACLVAQTALHNGLTGFPKPTAQFLKMSLDYFEAGMFKEPPTEQAMSLIVNGATPTDAYAIVEKARADRQAAKELRESTPKIRKATTKEVVTVTAAPGEVNEAAAKAGRAAPIAFSAEAAGITLKAEPPAEPKKSKKQLREEKLMARAEEEARKTAEDAKAKTATEDPDYDPLAGVGEPFPTGE